MRRSKSDPAKYARNYRSISQRRMTQYDGLDEEKEMDRLRSVLRNSQHQLKLHQDESDDDNDDDDEQESNNNTNDNDNESSKKKRKRASNDAQQLKQQQQENGSRSILSPELTNELGTYNNGTYNSSAENPLVILPSKSKNKKQKEEKKKQPAQLTPQEIKQAKLLQKNTTRKLQQLETRAAQKKKRSELYKQLEHHAQQVPLPQGDLMALLSSSGNLSRKDNSTKKQTLKKLLQKERAGISLTVAEKKVLYTERTVDEADSELPDAFASNEKSKSAMEQDNVQSPEDFVMDEGGSKKKNRTRIAGDSPMSTTEDGATEVSKPKTPGPTAVVETRRQEEIASDLPPTRDCGNSEQAKLQNATAPKDETENTPNNEDPAKPATSSFSFVAQMMASLSQLKHDTDQRRQEEVKEETTEEDISSSLAHEQKYVPSNPTVLKTAARLRLQSTIIDMKRRVVPISRPEAIEKARYDLPVSAMEFEIVDAIRNNDVTIVCAETGSGKSTQVCQFLYEAGFSKCPSNPEKSFLIGITQPRRVAAVSTAKRVCFEMGHGDGQSIKASGKKGNLVAYKTRYESAGVGTETNLLFATDGILLQEIQDDLLLRRYSVLVLDETHERNLNTDVLIGLLSAAIALRKKAAEEDESLVPLKLVLMSATLRVEDFTKNKNLFVLNPPALIRVPGRTFPVTVHHSKMTELDDYETAAFRKVCKIHRKLPNGGILVFLTGKQEIVRMVNRLRRALNPQKKSHPSQGRFVGADDVVGGDHDNAPREMDDDELDGDDDDVDGELDIAINDSDDLHKEPESGDDRGDNRPANAYILPLYSMLSAEEQAKVFAAVPENHRLIVIATNIAETSITIPGVSYVVDTGRQKCRNYHTGTGVVSYDIMWISKAAADQRAGRAGRTGPGHCYRLYSSSLYSRHMDAFAVPEVLLRPLEDVVLSMKALKISDIAKFPFPTPPERSQVNAAVKLLANIGCIDVSNIEEDGGDGAVTKLGLAVAQLPLGVRYGKMLLVAAQAGVLDYAITMVAVLSEASPFQRHEQSFNQEDAEKQETSSDDDSEKATDNEAQKKKKKRWQHRGGDVMAAMLAVGAYTYVGRGAGGVSEQVACRKFCDENGLNYMIMTRVQKLRLHLARLAKIRLSKVDSIASKTGGIVSSMRPPNRLQENLLMQAIASGLLDNIALLAPPGSISGEHPFSLRTAYLSCSNLGNEPLFMDRDSVVFSRDSRQLPQWVCYDSVLRKTAKDGTPVSVMKKITPIEASWLGALAKGSRLLVLGAPLSVPSPNYDVAKDAVMCAVVTKFGSHGWEIPPVRLEMFDVVQSKGGKHSAEFMAEDSFRWFARFLLEGNIISDFKGLQEMLNDSPAIITRRAPVPKVGLLVSELSSAGVDNAAALKRHWAEKDNKFLFKCIKSWIKRENQSEAKQLWIATVKKHTSAM